MFSLPDLAEAVHKYMQDNLPGRTPRRLLIITVEDGSEEPHSIPIVPSISTSSATALATNVEPEKPADGAQQEEREPTLPRCVRDILSTMRSAGHPLTKMRLLEEMQRAGYEWSERTVDRYLKLLMEDGTIENPPDARPRGYRISE